MILVKSSTSRRVGLRENLKFKKEQDLTKGFNSGASFHIVNKASLADLASRIAANYPDGLENDVVTSEQFRPNIVVDLDTPYAED